MDPYTYIILTLIGLLFIGISISLILGKIPHNSSVGFRTRKTLADEDVWHKANRRGGWYLLAASAVMLLSLTVSLVLRSRFAFGTHLIWMLAMIALPFGAAIVCSVIYIKKL